MIEPETNPLLDAALRLYHSATTPQQERDAYRLARALGLPASYGESDDAGTTALNSIPLVRMTMPGLRHVTITHLPVMVDADACLVGVDGDSGDTEDWRYISNALRRAERRGIELSRQEPWMSRLVRWARGG